MSEGNGRAYRDAVLVERVRVSQVKRESDAFEGIAVALTWNEGEFTGLMSRADAARLRDALGEMLGDS